MRYVCFLDSAPRWICGAILLCSGACGEDGIDRDDGSVTPDGGAQDDRDAQDAEPDAENPPDGGGDLEEAGTDADTEDPCRGVPTAGRCVDQRQLERCFVRSGEPSAVVREPCRGGAECQPQGDGAHCVLAGSCADSSDFCADSLTLIECESAAKHVDCAAGCLSNPLGAVCAEPLETRFLTGQAEYELRRANDTLTDWSDPVEVAPARGMWVLTYRAESLVDAAITSVETGAFRVRVPAVLQAEDAIVLVAVGSDLHGGLGYVVADPGFGASETEHTNAEPAPAPRVWSWRFALPGRDTSAPLRIREQDGSGAALLFEAARDVFTDAETFSAPAAAPPLLVWWGVGTVWRCGACYTSSGVANVFGRDFGHQLRFDGSTDKAYWSDAVTRHEMGHYVMGAFGFLPREGGLRYFGEVTNPGLAWAEGWATFFGASERDSSIYYDKQFGGFFWFDIDARHYAFDDLPWRRANAADPAGLAQLIDENEVASMLWHAYEGAGDREPFLRALTSLRMTVAPFERGYTRRTWADPDHPEIFTDTGVAVPHLADFLDALRCSSSITPELLDAVTQPALHYPFDSRSPLCR